MQSDFALVCTRHESCQICFLHLGEAFLICPICNRLCSDQILLSPLINGNQTQCSILLKPTRGSFSRSYKPGDCLHVGVSGTDGTVVSFRAGTKAIERSGWSQSLCVLTAQDVSADQHEWTSALIETQERAPKSVRFHCLDFAVAFLTLLLNRKDISFDVGAAEFVSAYVKPKLDSLWRFCQLYRFCPSGQFVIFMADDMEDDWAGDRAQDNRDFTKNQLNQFKHTYADAMVETESESMQMGFEHGFDRHVAQARRLGKAAGAIRALQTISNTAANDQTLSSLYASINNTWSKFQADIFNADSQGASTELDVQFAGRGLLPAYDPQDMELFGIASTDPSSSVQRPVACATPQASFQLLVEQFEYSALELITAASHILQSYGFDASEFLF